MVLEKTWEEHVDFLTKMIKLKLFYLWNYCKDHPDDKFQYAIREKVDIFQLTSFNNNSITSNIRDFDSSEKWIRKEKAIQEAYIAYKDDCAAFEEIGHRLLEESIEQRPDSDLTDMSFLDGYQCGSLKYDNYDPIRKSVCIHFANALQPFSPFEDSDYLKTCLLDLIQQCEEKYNAKFLEMTSWLNSYQKWLNFFPESWLENRSEGRNDINWTYGFWGQFITARRTFNTALGLYYRENKKLKYPLRHSFCYIKDLKEHLKNI